MWRSLVVAACLAPVGALAAGPKPEPTRGPVRVFVTVKPAPTPLSPEQLKAKQAKAEELGKRFKDLEKSNQKQFSKKQDKWPAEARLAYLEAREAQNTAVTDVWYAAPSEKDKADSAQDVWKALGGEAKEPPKPKDAWVALVADRKEADIVVEVLGRYGQSKVLVGDKYIGFELLPGRTSAKVLAQVPREWTEKVRWLNLVTDHWLKASEPFFRFEVTDTERWRDVAWRVAEVTIQFAKENYDLLKPAK